MSIHPSRRLVRLLVVVAAPAALAFLISPGFAASKARREPSVRTPIIRRPTISIRPGRLATVHFEATSPSWSPDGKQIAFIQRTDESRAGNLWLATVGGSVRQVTKGGGDGAPAWTPDGRLVVAHVSGDKISLQVVNPANGSERPLVPGRTFPVAGRDKVPSNISFSPDGAKVTFDVCNPNETMDESGKILMMNLKTSSVDKVKTPSRSVTSHPSWSPDGRYIAYQRLPEGWYYNREGGDCYTQVWVTDLQTGESRQVTTPEKEMNFVSPTWCPAGGMLAVEKWLLSMKRESRRETWLVNASNTRSGALLQIERRGTGGIEWAPDGTHYTYISSLAVNGKFVNELWTDAVTSAQLTAAKKLPPATTAAGSVTLAAK